MKDEINWIDRMYDLMGTRSQKDFAEWLGESPKRVNNYFSGMVDYPSGGFLLRLAEKGVNVNWFLTGRGEMYVSHAADQPQSADIQMLLHELEGWEELTPHVVSFVRNSKDLSHYKYETAESFERLKTIVAEAMKFGKKRK